MRCTRRRSEVCGGRPGRPGRPGDPWGLIEFELETDAHLFRCPNHDYGIISIQMLTVRCKVPVAWSPLRYLEAGLGGWTQVRPASRQLKQRQRQRNEQAGSPSENRISKLSRIKQASAPKYTEADLASEVLRECRHR
eukprot:gene14541-biopygen390